MDKTIARYIIEGSIALENGNHFEALSNYKEVLKTVNDFNLIATYKSGICFMKLGEYNKAIHFFNEVLASNPLHRNTLLKLSYCYMQNKQYEDMIKVCDIVYNLDNKLKLEAI